MSDEAVATGAWDRVAQPWRRLRTATRQLVVLGVVAILLVVGFVVPVSVIVTRSMRAGVDADLRHHIGTLRTILAWEGYYLRAEARTLAGLEGVDEALQARDTRHLNRLVATVQDTHKLDAVYVVTSDGDVLVSSTLLGPDPAAVVRLDLVREGLQGLNVARIVVAGEKVLLMGIAPHVGQDGRIDAVFLLARELDHDYLAGVGDTLGTEVVLTDGQRAVSSLSPDDYDRLQAAVWLPGSPASDEMRLQHVRIGSASYRLLLAPLSLMDSPQIVAALLQPTALIEDTIRQTVGWVVALGGLLVGLILVLVQFHVRAIFKPLQSLAQAAEVVAAGNLDQPLSVQGAGEVRVLANGTGARDG